MKKSKRAVKPVRPNVFGGMKLWDSQESFVLQTVRISSDLDKLRK